MRLKALIGGLSVAIGCLVAANAWAEGELTVVSWGGALHRVNGGNGGNGGKRGL